MLCTPLPFVRLEPLLAPKFHLSVSFAAAQALQRLQAARCVILVIYLRKSKGMLCTPLPFVRLDCIKNNTKALPWHFIYRGLEPNPTRLFSEDRS
jgi:hypothetical protein